MYLFFSEHKSCLPEAGSIQTSRTPAFSSAAALGLPEFLLHLHCTRVCLPLCEAAALVLRGLSVQVSPFP